MMVLNSPRGPSPVTPKQSGADECDDDLSAIAMQQPKSQSRTSEAALVVPIASSSTASASSLPSLSYNDAHDVRAKYERANALVASIFNKFYNGSSRAVDPFVIRCLQEEETRLFSLQCFIEQGPSEKSRERKASDAIQNVAQATSPSSTLWTRLFGICGGYMGGPGSVMREWDSISSHAAGLEDALLDYIAIVDKILPGWDRPLPHEFPVAQQDKFWRDDLAADACTSCGVAFSGVQCRRHHCRLCFDIFCATCCAECIDLALCPGAPIRRQRVCLPCFEVAEKDRSLLAVRRMIRENHALEQQIKDVTTATEALVSARQRDEAKLRGEAMRCGCVLEQIDAEIEKQIGSPVSVTVKLPPSHKFAPRESVDANAQLALAHRQLLMGLKVAQCRAKKAVEKMDISLRVLREAICFGAASPWHVALRHASPFLTLRELHVLLTVSHTTRHSVQQGEFERQCVLAQDLPSPAWRPFVWQTQWLQDARTREYLADLAEAIRAKAESDSESEEEEDGERGARRPTCHAVVAHLLLGAHVSPARRSVWKTVYEFLLARCDDDASGSQSGEFDAQIQGDVGRTFGVSSLRSRQSPAQMKNAMAVRKAYQRAGASTLETPLALRKTALTNVLRAFASVSSGVGYCQGMDHVAAILLSVVDWNESDAFWMLTSLMVSPQYELDKLYGPGLPHLNVRVFQLERLLAIHLPELYAHLHDLDFPVSMLTTSWFMTLFCNMEALSYDLVLRVLDGFFLSGWKFLFRIALAIIEVLQHHMLASSFEEMPQVFYDIHTIAPQLAGADAHTLLTRAQQFKVTASQLQRLADEYEERGGTTRTSPRVVLRGASTSLSPTHVSNGNGAGVPVGVAIIGSPRRATIANGAPSTNGHGPHVGPTDLLPGSPPRSPLTRRSRNSSNASASNDSDASGNRSPHSRRGSASSLSPPMAFHAPPQRYSMSSASSLQYGIATPLNANHYF